MNFEEKNVKYGFSNTAVMHRRRRSEGPVNYSKTISVCIAQLRAESASSAVSTYIFSRKRPRRTLRLPKSSDCKLLPMADPVSGQRKQKPSKNEEADGICRKILNLHNLRSFLQFEPTGVCRADGHLLRLPMIHRAWFHAT